MSLVRLEIYSFPLQIFISTTFRCSPEGKRKTENERGKHIKRVKSFINHVYNVVAVAAWQSFYSFLFLFFLFLFICERKVFAQARKFPGKFLCFFAILFALSFVPFPGFSQLSLGSWQAGKMEINEEKMKIIKEESLMAILMETLDSESLSLVRSNPFCKQIDFLCIELIEEANEADSLLFPSRYKQMIS